MGLFQRLHLSDSGSHVFGGELALLYVWIFIHTSVFLVLETTTSHGDRGVDSIAQLSLCLACDLSLYVCLGYSYPSHLSFPYCSAHFLFGMDGPAPSWSHLVTPVSSHTSPCFLGTGRGVLPPTCTKGPLTPLPALQFCFCFLALIITEKLFILWKE